MFNKLFIGTLYKTDFMHSCVDIHWLKIYCNLKPVTESNTKRPQWQRSCNGLNTNYLIISELIYLLEIILFILSSSPRCRKIKIWIFWLGSAGATGAFISDGPCVVSLTISRNLTISTLFIFPCLSDKLNDGPDIKLSQVGWVLMLCL